MLQWIVLDAEWPCCNYHIIPGQSLSLNVLCMHGKREARMGNKHKFHIVPSFICSELSFIFKLIYPLNFSESLQPFDSFSKINRDSLQRSYFYLLCSRATWILKFNKFSFINLWLAICSWALLTAISQFCQTTHWHWHRRFSILDDDWIFITLSETYSHCQQPINAILPDFCLWLIHTVYIFYP